MARERRGGDADKGGDVCHAAVHTLRPAGRRRAVLVQRRARDRGGSLCKVILTVLHMPCCKSGVEPELMAFRDVKCRVPNLVKQKEEIALELSYA